MVLTVLSALPRSCEHLMSGGGRADLPADERHDIHSCVLGLHVFLAQEVSCTPQEHRNSLDARQLI